MSDFEDMRPYHDDEVPEVIARILDHGDIARGASYVVPPGWLRGLPGLGVLARWWLRRRTRQLRTVSDCQAFIAVHFGRLVDRSITQLTCSGLDQIQPDQAYLFVSNHRDIVLDSSLLNYLLYNNHMETSRIAVGDNLLRNQLAADMMRLNKSFVVQRSVTGAKALLKALSRTSAYVRHSLLEEHSSIWIAQREGRAKDGWDRTDPALVKMLALAHKNEQDPSGLEGLFSHCNVVPVSVSYEVDPCAPLKARELSKVADDGHYDKSEDEDVDSIVTGLMGFKGRVHVHIGTPLNAHGDVPASAEEAAQELDRQIVNGLRLYPTHLEAAELLQISHAYEGQLPELDASQRAFRQQLESCSEDERPWLLAQYANAVKNRLELQEANTCAEPSSPAAQPRAAVT